MRDYAEQHLLLDVDKDTQHVLVNLQSLQQSSFTVNRNRTVVKLHTDVWTRRY